MAEDGITPEVARIFQKTEVAQRKRAEAAERPLNLVDRFFGLFISGDVDSEYTEGRGGRVATRIESGRAGLNQEWRFDERGNVIGVDVVRYFLTSEAGGERVSFVSLRLGEDGKFVVHKKSTSRLLPAWNREFNTAKKRMAVGKQK